MPLSIVKWARLIEVVDPPQVSYLATFRCEDAIVELHAPEIVYRMAWRLWRTFLTRDELTCALTEIEPARVVAFDIPHGVLAEFGAVPVPGGTMDLEIGARHDGGITTLWLLTTGPVGSLVADPQVFTTTSYQ